MDVYCGACCVVLLAVCLLLPGGVVPITLVFDNSLWYCFAGLFWVVSACCGCLWMVFVRLLIDCGCLLSCGC